MNTEDPEDSDLNDIHKIEIALAGTSSRDNDSEYYLRCDSGDGYSPSEASSYQQHLTPSHPDNTFSIFEELTSECVEEDRIIISELEPSYENALCLNRAYQSMLFELSQQLEVLRNVNEHKQKILLTEIEILKAKFTKKPEKKTKKKPITFSYFGMPYFKDESYNTPPMNSDAKLACNLGYRNISLIMMNKPLSKFEIRKLRKELKEQAIVLESTRLIAIRDKLQEQLEQSSISKEEKKAIQDQIKPFQRQIYDVRSLPDEILMNVPPTSFDWIKLSIQSFFRSRTPDQLRLHWMHYLRPGVNSRPWKHEENRMLKDLIKATGNGIDWDEVAENLNSGRTPFGCFRHYQEKFNIEIRRFGWTNEDNVLLLSLIGSFHAESMSDIYWEEVRRNFPGKSKAQIYAHFRYHIYSLDPSPFAAHEDIAILEGIKMGYDFSDISLVLGKRSIAQIRNRYKIIQKRGMGLEKNWTEKENNMLLAMPDASKLRAHIIRRDFPGRNFPQLFSRFHYLRMKSTSPKEYIEDLKNKRMYSQKSWFPKENRKVASKIVSMMSSQGYKQHVVGSMSKTLPMLKNSLLNFSRERNLIIRGKLLHPNIRVRHIRCKRSVKRKEKELKAILCPLLPSNTKRPRKLCFPGDGRELGITFTSIYRLLQCNFTLAPEMAEFTEENCERFGIAYENYLPFKELLNLTKNLPVPELSVRTGQLHWLPPSLGTLTGYRGLDLHRAYLHACASAPIVTERNTATITEIPDEPTPGPSGYQSAVVPRTLDVGKKANASGGNAQQENNPVLGAPVSLTGRSEIEQSFRNTANPSGKTNRIVPGNDERNSIGASIQVENETSSETETDEEEVDEDEVEVETPQPPNVPNDVYFGDRIADSLLLSRLTTLFFWSGIMGSMYASDVSNQIKAQEKTMNDPSHTENGETAKTVKAKTVKKKMSKQEMIRVRKENIRQVVLKRYGKCKALEKSVTSTTGDGENSGDAIPSTSTEPTAAVDVEDNPPPAKKPRKKPIRKGQIHVAKSDRVTRHSKKLCQDIGN